MKSKFTAFCMFVVAGALAYTALADANIRVSKKLPAAAGGTNAVVAVSFNAQPGTAVEPIAFDLFGGTASSGTVTAYQIRDFGGSPVTNTLKAAASCAATNAFTVADYRGYCYANEPVYFKFSLAAGGQLVIYAKTKE
jgi:hypothetical protein